MSLLKIALVGGAVYAFIRSRKKARMPSPHVKLVEVPPALRSMMEENPDDLPRLPIPTLEDTLTRYLASVKPHVSTEEYALQEKMAEDFKTGAGVELQQQLIDKDSQVGYPYSFIEQHWDEMYNSLRCPAPVNISPCFGIADEKDFARQAQVPRAARFVHGFARWASKITEGNLESDKGMCSYAYPKHFGSAKIPKKDMDHLVMYSSEARHVIVLCNGHIFSLQLLEEGKLVSVTNIEAKLNEIVQQAQTPFSGVHIQMMTATERNAWASVRDSLEQDAHNLQVLRQIDSGLIVLCLDPKPRDPSDLTERTANMLVPTLNKANRWWDKQMVIVDGAGGMGITFEHSYGDGTNWGRFIREIMEADTPAAEGVVPLPVMEEAQPKTPQALTFAGAEAFKAQVSAADVEYSKAVGDVDLAVVDFKDFGKNEIKKWNCSPDAVAQLSFQAAYFHLNKRMPPVYEAGATRKFLHGRTETIRSCTEASATFVKAFEEGQPKEKLVGLMQAAAKVHGSMAKAAAGGCGIDRHLTALEKNCVKAGLPTPELFTNPAFQESRNWALSTSNGSQPYISLFGFGAVIPEGYGIGYLINGNDISVVITSYKSCSSTSSQKMAEAITTSLRSMKKSVE